MRDLQYQDGGGRYPRPAVLIGCWKVLLCSCTTLFHGVS